MSEANNRTLTIEKTFDAPLKLVWEAWTQPEHVAKWWGPKGMEVKVVAHDFKVGGQWKYVMMMPNGNEFISEGEYSEIIEFKKIVTSTNFIPMTMGVTLEILFEEKGATTSFIFNCIHPTEEYCQQQEKMGFYNGWGSTFDRLEVFLNSKK